MEPYIKDRVEEERSYDNSQNRVVFHNELIVRDKKFLEANRSLIEFLSDITGFRKSAFSISSGHKSRDKSVLAIGATMGGMEKIFSEILP